MSFATIQALVRGKRPFFLYRLERGGDERFYTNSGQAYETTDHDWFDQLNIFSQSDFFTRTWAPNYIKHSKIRETSSFGRASTDLSLKQSDTWARTFLNDNGYQTTRLRIYKGFSNDPDGEIVLQFNGRVVAVKPSYTTIMLKTENRFTEMRRGGAVRVLQKPCPWSLYNTLGVYGCRLSFDDWAETMSATAYDAVERTITVPDAEAAVEGTYRLGQLEYGTYRELITEHSGSTISLLALPPGLADAIDAASGAGVTVRLAPGCDRTMTNCAVFNNLDNFGGYPWMDVNPYDGRNVF